jgi:hypothetical protein
MKTPSLFLAFSVVLASTSAGAANGWQVKCGDGENPAHFHVNGHSARIVNDGPAAVQVWAHDAHSQTDPPTGITPSRIAAGDAAAVACNDCEVACADGAAQGQVAAGTWSKLKK